MALPINIEDLLNKRKVEGNRIEFKKGWNPAEIYHSICAFANDFDNLGGGYILVGVEENEYGIAKRPVTGINIEAVDGILKKMVGFNNMFDPYYLPRTSVEEVDGQQVLVVWAPSGVNRPYAIPMDVTAKEKKMKYYIRSGSSSIVAKGEVLDELRDMANRVPFDERPNPEITLKDISMVLLRDYLATIGSKLEASLFTQPLVETLEQMELMTGPIENRLIKNVAAMMFCENPEKFFPYTQVEIVRFPEGKMRNPQNFSEKTFKGSVPQIIKQTMDYFRTYLLLETVQKVSGRAEANRFWNYPYDALEEAVVNSMYHRDYQQHEPVEITIEPEGVSILNCPGPDRSIPMSAIEKGDNLKSRRYRNRRLGDFLKELDLTEGRSTGIPTIQEKLAANGSLRATFETTEDRLTFLIHIPVHAGWGNKPVSGTDDDGPVATERTTERTTETATETTTEKIVRLIRENPHITNKELAAACDITEDGVYWNTKKLRKNNIIRRVGGDFGGYWEVLI